MAFGGFIRSVAKPVTKALGQVTDPIKDVAKDVLPVAVPLTIGSVAVSQVGAYAGAGKTIDGAAAPVPKETGMFGDFFTDLGRGLGTIGRGLGEFTGGVQTAGQALAPFGVDILPGGLERGNVGQQTALETMSRGAQEGASSGTVPLATAGLPALAPSLLQGGRALLQGAGRALQSPGGIGLGVGLGAGELVDMFQVQGKKMRITRKMKAQVRQVYNMTGMNPQATAQILSQMSGMTFTVDMVFAILLKRFRNDGPVVTKAAMRKTKQTLRRMKSMCDMYDDVTKRPAARRTTTRRRSSTNVVNVK